MPLPGSHREKQLLQEIVEPAPQAEFLQEIKEPVHEETLVEAKPKKRSRRSKKSA